MSGEKLCPAFSRTLSFWEKIIPFNPENDSNGILARRPQFAVAA
jgi:hypothetical protein